MAMVTHNPSAVITLDRIAQNRDDDDAADDWDAVDGAMR